MCTAMVLSSRPEDIFHTRSSRKLLDSTRPGRPTKSSSRSNSFGESATGLSSTRAVRPSLSTTRGPARSGSGRSRAVLRRQRRKTALTVAFRTALDNGVKSRLSAPISRATMPSTSSCRSVRAMMGAYVSLRRRRQRSTPAISGRFRSARTASGRARLHSPSPAVPDVATSTSYSGATSERSATVTAERLSLTTSTLAAIRQHPTGRTSREDPVR